MRNVLFIEGGAYTDIRKALSQWIDLYSPDLKKELSFEIYKAGRGSHIIKADDELPDEHFNYLLNYLKYPEEIDYKAEVTGYTKISETTVFPKDRQGEDILIFIPENDTEYDYVHWVTKDGGVYRTDFGGKTIESDALKTYKEVDFDPKDYPAPEIIYAKPYTKPAIEPPDEEAIKRRIALRFKIIAIITGVAILVSLFFYKDPVTFITFNQYIGFGVMAWFATDYKMLQLNKYYNLSFIIAVLLCLYSYQLRHTPPYLYKFVGNIELFLSFPVIFLVVQKPLRLAFKKIIKREPVIEKPMPSFADFLYFMLLIAGVFLLGLLIRRTVI